MKHGPNVWVVRRGSRFSIREEGSHRYLVPRMPQYAAIRIARLIARENRSELIVQGRSGQVRARDSHGFDSRQREG